MTVEEEAFNRQLDLHPDDHTTRLVFADWLEEQGDDRANGYRALAVNGRIPHRCMQNDWLWATNNAVGKHHVLPQDWFDCLSPDNSIFWPSLQNMVVRSEAEDAAAKAFSLLPSYRQAELLAAVEGGVGVES